ncbi:MAG TPA: hypothetical protein PKI61_00490 [bacterium]|nr:hypothetical protein [bacterium]HPT29516.1 hypothetical protein [bacterium]
MIWLIILEIILAAILVLAAVDFFHIVFRGAAPFMRAGQKILALIVPEIKLKGTETIYELGAGQADFLQIMEKKYPKAKLIGIEHSRWLYFFSKMMLNKKKSRINLIREDLFKTDIKKADLIYVYLVPTMMAKLSERITKECRPKTIIISYLFSIPNLTISKKLDINGNSVYFYEV